MHSTKCSAVAFFHHDSVATCTSDSFSKAFLRLSILSCFSSAGSNLQYDDDILHPEAFFPESKKSKSFRLRAATAALDSVNRVITSFFPYLVRSSLSVFVRSFTFFSYRIAHSIHSSGGGQRVMKLRSVLSVMAKSKPYSRSVSRCCRTSGNPRKSRSPGTHSRSVSAMPPPGHNLYTRGRKK